MNFSSVAQNSLQEKYDGIIESTETYEQYKVIPRTTIDDFWMEVSDTLKLNKGVINDLQIKRQDQEAFIKKLEADILNLQSNLDSSLNQNDSINFVGISFSKVGYHLMVWLIIAVLAAFGVIAYLMFARSNRVTSRVKKDHDELIAEFDAHKDKAREAQVKLKRELQTALNTINERR
ncbi:hypothetical protein [Ekhidna sp.]